MAEGFADVRFRLHASSSEENASERAARAVLRAVGAAS